jgi:Asp-tRNA(Asn)/Glu-tRNA(Gln) amidotransferase A subunit family amidase
MALCWSLDKVGVLARNVQDTAIVLACINGGDSSDPSSIDFGFQCDSISEHPRKRSPRRRRSDRRAADPMNVQGMRVGYDPRWFEQAEPHDRAAFDAAKSLGVQLVEIRLPDIPSNALVLGLLVEAAAAFEELTLTNKDDLLDWQDADAWPNTFRQTRFISAIDYVQIDRLRRRAMQEMHDIFSGVDALIGPNYAGGMLTITNFTGHPQLAYRTGFIDSPARNLQNQPVAGSAPRRTPRASSLWAPLFEERNLIRLGRALETRLNVAHERPPLGAAGVPPALGQ